jgi:hypothetical protein
MANLNLPDDQMREIVSAAILQTVTAENRDTLITEAIANLLRPKEARYGPKTSLLQEAFDFAVNEKARQILTEMLDTDQKIKAQVSDIIAKAAEKAFNEERKEQMIDSMARAIATAFRDLP